MSIPSADLVARLRSAGCVFAEEEAALLAAEARDGRHLEAMVVERVAGRPLEQILGWVEFCGLRVGVAPGTFVPRRRTEHLAELAVGLAAQCEHPVVVELCCGVSAIGVVLLDRLPQVDLTVSDLDEVAVSTARRNLGNRAVVLGGDLDEQLPDRLHGAVDVLIANAPYVPSDEVASMPQEARTHEPRQALDGGPDGLSVARRIVARASRWLAPKGHLVIETSRRQAESLTAEFEAVGLQSWVSVDDRRGSTAVVGRPY